ncbi:MAG: hypothetical protein R3B95_10065 [Nitrospirales bacterium]|nr:hypothetical protein [Nitrospirales bacterium]
MLPKELAVENKVDSLEFRQMEKLDEALLTKICILPLFERSLTAKKKTWQPFPGSNDG